MTHKPRRAAPTPPHHNIVVQLELDPPRWVLGFVDVDGTWHESVTMPATPSEDEPAQRATRDGVQPWAARMLDRPHVRLHRVADTRRATWWVTAPHDDQRSTDEPATTRQPLDDPE
ncbi:hypothetical protein [Saccharopolyspora sp. NPDC002686]|uniref:hypothetical protein n=1 Tax=Saccharopolyspora sp. NPDC002686 TaxID=3154541 RepID=UPI00331695B5